MANTLVRNISGTSILLPPPFVGLLPADTSFITKYSESEVNAILGTHRYLTNAFRIEPAPIDSVPSPGYDGPTSWYLSRIADLQDPVNPQDAATRHFVQNSLGNNPSLSVPLSFFDPGAQDPRRWNTAFEAAMVQQGIKKYQLLIDANYQLTERVTLTLPMDVRGIAGLAKLSWTNTGNAGMFLLQAAGESRIDTVTFDGPDPFTGEADIGILIEAPRCIFTNLLVSNWGGIGVSVNADINRGSNGNENRFTNVQAVLCGNAKNHQDGTNGGFYLTGGDSNGCLFLSCDATDSRRGFFDHSFLGNTFIGCSVEGCNTRFTNPTDPVVGYGFLTQGPSTRSLFLGCYSEGDSTGVVNDPAMIVGGYPANRGNAVIYSGRGVTEYLVASGFPYTDPVVIPPGPTPNRQVAVQIGGDETGTVMVFTAQNPSTGLPVVYPTRLKFGKRAGLENWWQLNYAELDSGDVMRFRGNQLWLPNDVVRGASGRRDAWAPSLAEANTNGPTDGTVWAVGDRLNINQPVANAPSTYRCMSVNELGVATWAVESVVNAAYQSGTYDPTITTNIANATASEFIWTRVGNVVQVNGFISQISIGTQYLRVTLPVPNASNLTGALTYGGINATGGDPDAPVVGSAIFVNGAGDTAEATLNFSIVNPLAPDTLWAASFSYTVP